MDLTGAGVIRFAATDRSSPGPPGVRESRSLEENRRRAPDLPASARTPFLWDAIPILVIPVRCRPGIARPISTGSESPLCDSMLRESFPEAVQPRIVRPARKGLTRRIALRTKLLLGLFR